LAWLVIAAASLSSIACATAQDDGIGIGGTTRPRDGGGDVIASPDSSNAPDSGSPATDSGRVTDSGSVYDTYVGYDTYVDDTYTDFDTYVPPPDDTGTPPPFDTGTGGGGPCLYCLGTCSDPVLDELCFIDCISAGATNCRMSGTVCTCIP
jgi:hypothetical protein